MAYIQHALTPAQETPAAPAPGAPPAAAPVAPALPPEPDYADILDQLTQRKDFLGTDLMMVLDEHGVLLARTDRPAITSGAQREPVADETFPHR